MRKVTAEEAKAGLDELLRGLEAEDVVIEAEGEPVAVLLPLTRYAAEAEARRAWLRAALAEGRADLEAGRVIELGDPDSLAEAVLSEARARRRSGRDAA